MTARIDLSGITRLHHFAASKKGETYKSIEYRLRPVGFEVAGSISMAGLETVRRIWRDFKEPLVQWSDHYGVPVEIIIATIATESAGKPRALRKEPGYKSDAATPHRVSPGLMQTLISTARSALKDKSINRQWLFVPSNSIKAGTAYIAQQSKKTGMDPPLVFAAYNAGGVYLQTGANNRWKTRQFPIGTGKHVDRAVNYFNACFAMWGRDGDAPKTSFVRMLDGPVAGDTQPTPKPDPGKPEGPSNMFKTISNLFGVGGLSGLLTSCGKDGSLSGDMSSLLSMEGIGGLLLLLLLSFC